MAQAPNFPSEILVAICRVLGDTDAGLTGTEIGQVLAELRIADTDPGITKYKRLYNALAHAQTAAQRGVPVVQFIVRSMAPGRHVHSPDRFRDLQSRLNVPLALIGTSLRDDGQLVRVVAASTLDEAQERANRLQSELRRRKVHGDVLRFCQREYLQENFFHAVFEAAKSVAEKIRSKTGLTLDGSDLAEHAFSIVRGMPLLAFNALQTQTERSEHIGLTQLTKGMFGAFRNTTAHAPKILWEITEQDALDMMTLASMIHRRLDSAIVRPSSSAAN